MYKRHDFGIRILFERVFKFLRVAGLAPLVFDDHGDTTGAFDVFHHAAAKHAILHHHDLVARLDHVDET